MEFLHMVMDLFVNADRFLINVATNYGALIYLTLFAIFFSETGLVVMAFLPGDSLLFVAGAVAATGAMDVGVLMAVVIIGASLGNTLNYYIGRWLGRKIYDGSIGWIDQAALKKTHDFYDRHGGKTIMLARFIPIVRSFAPLVAGAAGMPMQRFQFYSIAGAVLWIMSLVGGGYLFGNIPFIKQNLSLILVVGILAALGPISLAALVRWWKLRRAARA
ncbi:MAG: VTT domain-containing protein [Burkholderiaceae bacterium]